MEGTWMEVDRERGREKRKEEIGGNCMINGDGGGRRGRMEKNRTTIAVEGQ